MTARLSPLTRWLLASAAAWWLAQHLPAPWAGLLVVAAVFCFCLAVLFIAARLGWKELL